MYIEEKHSSSLAKFLNQFDLTIMDTCSLMDEGFTKFADDLSNGKEYLKKGNEIIVLRRCVKELKKHSKDEKNDSKRIDAIRALKILKNLKKDHIVKFKFVFGNKNFADNVIYTYSSVNRISKTILVITQDKFLCQDLKILNQSLSQGGRPISIYRFSPTGVLEENRGRPDLVLKPNQNIRKQFSEAKQSKKLAKPLKEKRVLKKVKKVKIDKDLEKLILEADSQISKEFNNSVVKRFIKIEHMHDQLDRLVKLNEDQLSELKLLFNKEKLITSLKSLESVKVVEKVKIAKTTKVKETKKCTKSSETITSNLLEDLKNREVKLMANMSNPTYPKENKIADLEGFKIDLKKLKVSEKKQLKLSLEKINEVLKSLK